MYTSLDHTYTLDICEWDTFAIQEVLAPQEGLVHLAPLVELESRAPQVPLALPETWAPPAALAPLEHRA